MKIIVTGAAGLVGRELVPALAASHQVWAVTRRAQAASSIDGVTSVQADLASPDFVTQLPAAADVVIHLAQSPRYAEFPEGARDMFDVNVASTARLLEWARRSSVRQFILASSGAVVLPGHEQSFYAASKKSAELFAQSYADLFNVLVLRPFFIYGRGQRSTMLVPRLIGMVQSGREVRLTGADGSRLNPIHVDDAVAAIVSAVTKQVSGTINVAGPQVVTIREMSEAIGRHLGITPRFAADNGEPADLTGDITMLREQLIAPQRTFDAGVSDLVAALRAEAT